MAKSRIAKARTHKNNRQNKELCNSGAQDRSDSTMVEYSACGSEFGFFCGAQIYVVGAVLEQGSGDLSMDAPSHGTLGAQISDAGKAELTEAARFITIERISSFQIEVTW